MKPFTLKTYTGGEASPHSFFILNKGKNSGKPLTCPCPNCFILSVPDASVREFYYWLTYGLWQAKAFHPYLVGSVIEFIHIKELKTCIEHAAMEAGKSIQDFNKAVVTLQKIQHTENLIQQQQVLLKQAKRAVFREYMPKL